MSSTLQGCGLRLMAASVLGYNQKNEEDKHVKKIIGIGVSCSNGV